MKAIIYPRGFIGNGENINLVMPKEPTEQDFITAAKLNRTVVVQEKVFASNQDVDDVYSVYQTGSEYTKSFEFREQVIKVALKAFGTNDFNEWCTLQLECPFFTAMHRKFLNETIYVLNGGSRQTNLMTWTLLLTPILAIDSDKNININIDENIKSVKDAIVTWFSIENGIPDLIQTLNILFGNKSSV